MFVCFSVVILIVLNVHPIHATSVYSCLVFNPLNMLVHLFKHYGAPAFIPTTDLRTHVLYNSHALTSRKNWRSVLFLL